MKNKKLKIEPYFDGILVRPFSGEIMQKSPTGLIKATAQQVEKEMKNVGEILAIGVGVVPKVKEGVKFPVKLKVGMQVIFSSYGLDKIEVEGEELIVLKEESIKAYYK